jgi:hypothetical protein
VLLTTRDDAPSTTMTRGRRTAVRGLALAAALAASVSLSGCVSSDAPQNSVMATAGNGQCKLPTLTVEPTSFKPGDKVKLSGVYFVNGCGGKSGLKPLELISAVLTDAKGANLDFTPIDAEGSDGKFEREYQVPKSAAAGAGRIIVGQAAPVAVVIED